MDGQAILKIFLCTAGAFVLGSVPVGLILTKVFSSKDIRTQGSGNIGATNVARVAGARLGLITLTLDLLKGAVPVAAAGLVVPSAGEPAMALAGLAAVAGHCYPVFSGFTGGGKGVATACGAFLVAAPWACLGALMVFLAAVAGSKRVSPGSVLAAISLPAGTWYFYGTGPVAAAAAAVGLLVVVRHRANISRLLAGQEPPFFKKTGQNR
ncbi:MAG: glycerol-3-phosphate 1-O-acyltransferase PlsY [Thermodesulfobacteriota bacterium]|nr:glycerol-3-phosphate 1-O-acyltransferase PlsY [Thermodesulfobacteriota bacterium]